MQINPFNNDSVVTKIFDMFCDFIFSGELKPGDKLPPENELAEQLCVGRNSLREAKKMLTAIGVLQEMRGSGTFVADQVSPLMFNPLLFSMLVEAKNSDDVYELKVMFEVASIKIVIDKATDEEIELIYAELKECEELINKGVADINLFVKHDIDFHTKIYSMTKNPLIERIGKAINELFRQFMIKSYMQEDGIKRSISNHFKIINLIKNRDKENVNKVIEETMAEWKSRWL